MSYDGLKWKRICEMTMRNYINMKFRLERNESFSNLILIYYSIFLIISGVTSKFFPNSYNNSYASYFDIILSVIILACSIINNNSRHAQRIEKIQKSANELKNLKREINQDSLNEIKEKYKNC